MELKQKLQHLMARKSLNGQKLARLSRVSDSEISRILQGKSRPGLDNALRLARAVGVSLDFLADDAMDAEPAPPEDTMTSEERKLLGVCQTIGFAEANLILEAVRILGYEVAVGRLFGAIAKPVIEPGIPAAEARGPHAAPSRAAAAAGASA